jgi:hypothetical protein
MKRRRLPRYGTTPGELTAPRVHIIRLSGKPDSYWGRLWRVTTQAVRSARIGKTWRDHPTPPDTRPRAHRGNWGDLATNSHPEHP